MSKLSMALKTQIPSPGDTAQRIDVDLDSPLVIVGANGSGKTRLGAFIEEQHLRDPVCHRLSAQRALNFPDEVSTRGYEAAMLDLLYGGANIREHDRFHNRWGGHRVTRLLNDFERLLKALFSEDYEVSTKYLQLSRKTDEKLPAPQTKISLLKEIWERVHTQRSLEIGGGTVSACPPGGTPYKASELSDGERVTFYLIGQVLSVPPGSIVVIDEPEVHVHSAIQATLWDEIEGSRPDCAFIYITHDLKFAATRARAKKLWLKSFDGTNWDWAWIPDDSDFPEELLIQLLGSRRPILFVEGERDSWDSILYSQTCPGFFVVPVGSCSRVISFTKAFNLLSSLHHNKAVGLIDRDHRSDSEIQLLSQDQVFTSQVSEVENLLVLPLFVRAMARICGHPDARKVSQDLSQFIISEFTRFREVHALDGSKARVRRHFEQFSSCSRDLSGLKSDLTSHVGNCSPDVIYAELLASADALVAAQDVAGILKVFNHKALLPQVGTLLGLKSKEYEERVRHHVLFRSKNRLAKITAKYLPQIS